MNTGKCRIVSIEIAEKLWPYLPRLSCMFCTPYAIERGLHLEHWIHPYYGSHHIGSFWDGETRNSIIMNSLELTTLEQIMDSLGLCFS